MSGAEKMKVNVLEIQCLRSLMGVTRMDRVRNEEVHIRAGINRALVSREVHKVLKWFGQFTYIHIITLRHQTHHLLS